MVTTISKKTKKEKLKELVSSVNKKNKVLNASKYSGKIRIEEKP